MVKIKNVKILIIIPIVVIKEENNNFVDGTIIVVKRYINVLKSLTSNSVEMPILEIGIFNLYLNKDANM